MIQLSAYARMHRLDADDPEAVEQLARFLHEQYEDAAQVTGWDTQEGTSVPFEALPEANRETMLRTAEAVLRRYMLVRTEVTFQGPTDGE